MQLRQIVGDLRSMRKECAEAAAAEESASYELALSARRFSTRTRHHVDDKLNFSATLMRAGEVDAAHRLLAEFERDVKTEEAALFERVGEVKVAQAIRRERITRLRLIRMLAVAVLGAATLASSAVGISVAGMLADRAGPANERLEAPAMRDSSSSLLSNVEGRRLHRVRIAGVKVKLNDAQLRTYRQIVSGSVEGAGLEELLQTLPAPVVRQVREAMAAAASAAPRVVKKATRALFGDDESKKKDSDGKANDSSPEAEQPAEGDSTPSDGDGSGDSGGSGEGDGDDGLFDNFNNVGAGGSLSGG